MKLKIAVLLIGFVCFFSSVRAADAVMTDSQVDAAFAQLLAKEKRASIRDVLQKFQTKSTIQERREFVAGKKPLNVQIPMKEMSSSSVRASKAGDMKTALRFPKCKPHYGCRFRSVKRGEGDFVVIVDCPNDDLPCDPDITTVK